MTDGIRQLEILEASAREVFYKREFDELSLNDFMALDSLALFSARQNKSFTADNLKELCGHDYSASKERKVRCVSCLVELILAEANQRYPVDEKIQWLIKHYDALDDVLNGNSTERKFPGQIVEMQIEIEKMMSSWPIMELEAIQQKFIAIKNEIFEKDGDKSEMIPRFHVRIESREGKENRGEILKKDGEIQCIGSFVAVRVDTRSCFKKIVFALGLKPGVHILAGCGNASVYYSHLYQIRNFRFEIPNAVVRQTIRHWWNLLPSMIYKDALVKKEEFEKKGVATNYLLSDLWKRRIATKEVEFGTWIDGEALKAHLGIPNLEFRHTVRGLAARPDRFTGEWGVLILLEKGDQKSGGKANVRSGKFPAFGCPGGTVEDNKKDSKLGETIERALCRETENEAQCRKVVRIIAKVAEIKKQSFPDSPRINYDHWLYIEVDSEAGMSKNLVETSEIVPGYVRWVPLSEFASFTFQDSRHPIWNLERVIKEKRMYLGHATNLFQILPRVPGIKLPENWAEFGENIQKFKQGLHR